jgi:ABC-type amino acid transport substrate-binding protein
MKWMHTMVAGLMILAAASCSSIRPGKAGPLRVGFTPNYPPLAMLQHNKAAGVENDFAGRLALELGRELKLIEVPWSEQFEQLASGNIDLIMSGMTVTPSRRARVVFCDPYMSNPLVAVVRRGEADRYATAEAVKKTTGGIGFLEGTWAGSVVRREFQNGMAVPLSSPDDAVFHLVNQRIDLYIDDLAAAVDLMSRNDTRMELVPVPLREQVLAWAVRPDNPELLQQANAALARWRASGWLEETLDRWMPYRRGMTGASAD